VAGLKASFKFCETALAQVQDAQLSDSIDFFGGRKVTKAFRGADHRRRLGGSLQPDGDLPALERTAPADRQEGDGLAVPQDLACGVISARPMTPPPRVRPEPHMYSPLMGVAVVGVSGQRAQEEEL